VVAPSAFSAAESGTHKPKHEEDDCHNPQQVNREADAEEEQNDEECEQKEHEMFLPFLEKGQTFHDGPLLGARSLEFDRYCLLPTMVAIALKTVPARPLTNGLGRLRPLAEALLFSALVQVRARHAHN
jgi:hypothetical protein